VINKLLITFFIACVVSSSAWSEEEEVNISSQSNKNGTGESIDFKDPKVFVNPNTEEPYITPDNQEIDFGEIEIIEESSSETITDRSPTNALDKKLTWQRGSFQLQYKGNPKYCMHIRAGKMENRLYLGILKECALPETSRWQWAKNKRLKLAADGLGPNSCVHSWGHGVFDSIDPYLDLADCKKGYPVNFGYELYSGFKGSHKKWKLTKNGLLKSTRDHGAFCISVKERVGKKSKRTKPKSGSKLIISGCLNQDVKWKILRPAPGK
jgi:hypothetical protein